jgi:hypothetical protein
MDFAFSFFVASLRTLRALWLRLILGRGYALLCPHYSLPLHLHASLFLLCGTLSPFAFRLPYPLASAFIGGCLLRFPCAFALFAGSMVSYQRMEIVRMNLHPQEFVSVCTTHFQVFEFLS